MIGNRRATTLDGHEYTPGAKFRVIKEGLKLSGWVAIPGASQGWQQVLHVGDIITCTGMGSGMGSDPGYGVEWTSDEVVEARAFHVDTRPNVGGIWSYRPDPSFLEPVDD